MLTPEQCRAGRALLKWSQRELATAAQVSHITVRDFENGRTKSQRSTLTMLKQAMEAEGVEFTNGDTPGVRLHK